VVVLIVAAAALAFIVLYNLTNINIHERTREIASLKVLGFTRQEVLAYVFREIALLVMGGGLAGLGLGTLLVDFVVRAAEVNAVMFGRTVHPPSYLIAYALTLLFAAVVMLTMVPKLRRIDMVESLKSVD
jgi:putative ABC transport system permease protein